MKINIKNYTYLFCHGWRHTSFGIKSFLLAFFMTLPHSHINPKSIFGAFYEIAERGFQCVIVFYFFEGYFWQRQEVDKDRGRRHTICDFETAELY